MKNSRVKEKKKNVFFVDYEFIIKLIQTIFFENIISVTDKS